MFFVLFSEYRAIISRHSLYWFVMNRQSVLCEVKTEIYVLFNEYPI